MEDIATASAVPAEWRWTGALLVSGLVVFLVGAGLWRPTEFDLPGADGLRAIARHPGRISWIAAWMSCGMVLSTFGLASFKSTFSTLGRAQGTGYVAAFGLAAVLMIGFLVILREQALGVDPAPTAAIPARIATLRRVGGVLFASHMVLGYAAWVVLGVAVRDSGLLPPGLGWTGMVGGTLLLLGFAAFRGGPFAPPFLLHLYPAAVGIAMLWRPPT